MFPIYLFNKPSAILAVLSFSNPKVFFPGLCRRLRLAIAIKQRCQSRKKCKITWIASLAFAMTVNNSIAVGQNKKDKFS